MKGIMISWGTPLAGRERMALEEFASYMQWATGLKAQGKIGRFEIYAPVHGKYESFSGFTIVEGSESQIDAVLDSDDFRLRVDRVISVTKGVRLDVCDVGEGVAKRLKLYGSALQQLKL